jgi:hypothetical protein
MVEHCSGRCLNARRLPSEYKTLDISPPVILFSKGTTSTKKYQRQNENQQLACRRTISYELWLACREFSVRTRPLPRYFQTLIGPQHQNSRRRPLFADNHSCVHPCSYRPLRMRAPCVAIKSWDRSALRPRLFTRNNWSIYAFSACCMDPSLPGIHS